MKTRLKVAVGAVCVLVLGSWWMAANNPFTLSRQAVAVIQDSDDPALLENLLSRGVDPNYRITDESSLKDRAIDLMAGSPSNSENDNPTLLYLACTINASESASVLLKHGANPNLQSCYGRTPLFEALHNTNPDMVSLLLKHGADPNFAAQGQPMPVELVEQDLRRISSNYPVQERKLAVLSLLKQAGGRSIPIDVGKTK